MTTGTPLPRARALDPEFYVRPEWDERERTHVFARSWQLVAHADRLRRAGDHVVDEIAGRPLLVVRQEDGSLRAFDNVCRHRAGPLAVCDGRARVLRCRYHGWTYTLAGALQQAPEMDGAEGFDRTGIRLGELQVREWEGLVFVAMDPGAPPFDDVFDGIRERTAPTQLAALRHCGSERYEIACNWKVYVDNYLEGYHLPHVHPGLSRLLDYRAYDTRLSAWHSLQHSPIVSAGSAADGADPAGDDGEALYWFVFPNVMLNVTPGRLQTNRVVPLGVGRCRVDFEYYRAASGDGVDEPSAAADRAFSDEVQREDVGICEHVQKGLASGAYVPGRLSPRRESGVWHFHELLRRAYEGPPG